MSRPWREAPVAGDGAAISGAAAATPMHAARLPLISSLRVSGRHESIDRLLGVSGGLALSSSTRSRSEARCSRAQDRSRSEADMLEGKLRIAAVIVPIVLGVGTVAIARATTRGSPSVEQ